MTDDPERGYGRHYEYRVFSMRNDCPDENTGRRVLFTRMVWYNHGAVDYPTREEIFSIDGEEREPEGATIEELTLKLERRLLALNKPVLIFAEWFGGDLMPEWFQQDGERLRRRRADRQSLT
jgi:hypothetical protein